MTARQQHGFDFEDNYRINNNIKKPTNHTSKWDGFSCEERMLYNIKYTKIGKGVSLSDLFRQSKTTCDFFLVCGYYNENKDILVKTQKWLIDGKEWHKLFKWNYYKELKNWISSFPVGIEFNEKWTIERKAWTKKWNDSNKIPSLRFKRDSKGQKRMQVAINPSDFKRLIKNGKVLVLWDEN